MNLLTVEEINYLNNILQIIRDTICTLNFHNETKLTNKKMTNINIYFVYDTWISWNIYGCESRASKYKLHGITIGYNYNRHNYYTTNETLLNLSGCICITHGLTYRSGNSGGGGGLT